MHCSLSISSSGSYRSCHSISTPNTIKQLLLHNHSRRCNSPTGWLHPQRHMPWLIPKTDRCQQYPSNTLPCGQHVFTYFPPWGCQLCFCLHQRWVRDLLYLLYLHSASKKMPFWHGDFVVIQKQNHMVATARQVKGQWGQKRLGKGEGKEAAIWQFDKMSLFEVSSEGHSMLIARRMLN